MPLTDWKALLESRFAGRRVLVTGGAGFIGSHLAEALTILDAEVVIIDDLSHGTWENVADFANQVTCVTGSLNEAKALAKAMDGVELVFHLAGFGSVPRSVDDPDLYLEANALATCRILRQAQQGEVKRVIFSGSSNYYGDYQPGAARHEDMPPMPLSPYAATKLFGEGLMRAWSSSYSLDTVTLRYFNVFGPRQNPNSSYAAAIPAFCTQLLDGTAPTIYGDGEQTRDFTYVENVVYANLLAASHPENLAGEAFNIALGQPISVNQTMTLIRDILDAPIQPTYVPARPGEARHSHATIDKAQTTLGFTPLINFKTGLAHTINWYKQNS